MSSKLRGGLFYFHLLKDGRIINPEKVVEMSMKSQNTLHAAVYNHFRTNGPPNLSHFQVELNDYGLLIDFSATGEIDEFELDDLPVTLANKAYVVSFDRFQPEDSDDEW